MEWYQNVHIDEWRKQMNTARKQKTEESKSDIRTDDGNCTEEEAQT